MSEVGLGFRTSTRGAPSALPPSTPGITGETPRAAPAGSMPPPAHPPRPQLLHLPGLQPQNRSAGAESGHAVTDTVQPQSDAEALTAASTGTATEKSTAPTGTATGKSTATTGTATGGSTVGVTVGGEDAGEGTAQRGAEERGLQEDGAGGLREGLSVGGGGGEGVERDLVPSVSPCNDMIPLLRCIHHSECHAWTAQELTGNALLTCSTS